MVLELNKDNFDSEVLKSDIPVIVDFWAEWCGPCKMLAPVFEAVSKDFEGKVKFSKLNVDDNTDTASSFDVRSIPCLVVFKNGKEAGRLVGMKEEDQLKAEINELL